MKILLISNLYPPQIVGGYEVLAYQMTERLRADGHDVYVLTSNEVIRSEFVAEKFEHIHPRLRIAEQTFSDNSGDYRFQAHVWQRFNNEELHRVVDEFRPDVAYIWNTEGLGTFGIIHTLACHGLPMVWHLQDSVPYKAIEAAGSHAALVSDFFAREKSLRIITVSKTLTEELTSYGTQFAHPITEVRNWILPHSRERSDFWSPATDRPLRILFAGQLAPHKGFDFAIDALSALHNSGLSHFTFTLVGNQTKYVESALQRAHENGWGEKISFDGAKTMAEMADSYLAHDLFLFPTWSRDPMPIVVLESASLGCVPMLSEYCGTAEWVQDGIDAILVERDVSAIVASLTRVMSEPDYLSGIARYGLEKMQSNFSIDDPLSLVKSLLNSPDKGVTEDFYTSTRTLEATLLHKETGPSQQSLAARRLVKRALSGAKLKFVIWVDGLPWVRDMAGTRARNRENFPKG